MSMCGVYGPAQKIADLAEDWQQHLAAKQPRKIDYFKLHEATALKKQFAGWGKDDRDEKVRQLAACLTRSRLLRVGAWFKWKSLQDVAQEFSHIEGRHSLSQPFIQLVIYALSACISESVNRGYKQPMEIVFDNNDHFAGTVKRAYDIWFDQETLLGSAPHLAVMPTQPLFRDDKDFVVLQAADLLAGEQRLLAIADVDRYGFLRKDKKSLCSGLPVSKHYGDITEHLKGLRGYLQQFSRLDKRD